MLNIIKKRINKLLNRHQEEELPPPDEMSIMADKFHTNLETNKESLKQFFGESSDIVFRDIIIGKAGVKTCLVYTDGLVNMLNLHQNLLSPLMNESNEIYSASQKEMFSRIKQHALTIGEVRETEKIWPAVQAILSGEALLLVNGTDKGLIANSRGWDRRLPTEPTTEAQVRGPREGFTETLRVNTALLRRKIKHPSLRMVTRKIGRITNTDVTVVYIKGITNPKLLNEVYSRLERIDTDGILESGYIEKFIEDSAFSLFPLIEHTERPDKAAAMLLEGRVVIITDNTPFVLIAPTFLWNFIQASEDYYEQATFSTILIRLLRLAAILIATFLPSFYIAVTTYHQEMIPTALLISIAGSREGVPFPAFAEALMMETTFEILREAGLRLPQVVGQAVSIVGALVIGEAAICAGLVSPAMVIVVAATAISSFAIPAYNLTLRLRLLRFPIMFLAAVLGLYGVMLGGIVILIHLCSLRSFGIPFMWPVAPVNLQDLKDVFSGLPWWAQDKRPRGLRTLNPIRQAPGMKPGSGKQKSKDRDNNNV